VISLNEERPFLQHYEPGEHVPVAGRDVPHEPFTVCHHKQKATAGLRSVTDFPKHLKGALFPFEALEVREQVHRSVELVRERIWHMLPRINPMEIPSALAVAQVRSK